MPCVTDQWFPWTVDTPGWQQRPFHPKKDGYTKLKDAIIAQMKINKIPQSPQSLSTSSAIPAPTGTQAPSEANPVCDHTVTYSIGNVQNLQFQLKNTGNGNSNDNCCTGSPCSVLQKAGGAAAELCGPDNHAPQCAECANLGVAMNALNIDFQTNYEVGGNVSIPYLDGVTLQLQMPPHT